MHFNSTFSYYNFTDFLLRVSIQLQLNGCMKYNCGNCNRDVAAVPNTYRDDISDGYSIPDEKPTVGYSIPDEIPTTCFQFCELVENLCFHFKYNSFAL